MQKAHRTSLSLDLACEFDEEMESTLNHETPTEPFQGFNNNNSTDDSPFTTNVVPETLVMDDEDVPLHHERHVNTDCIRYHEIKLPVYFPDPDLKCDSCLRKSTSIHSIEISLYQAQPMEQIKGKKFGALVCNHLCSAQETCEFTFCSNCKDYYSKERSKHSDHWPSFILTEMQSTSLSY